MTQGEKICVHCGQSCAGQARVKDAKGNYAHTACAEQVKGKGTQGPPRAPAKPEQAGSMAAILADIDEADLIGGEHSCQGCGYPMDDNAMICLHCGFNRNSGRQFNTKVGRDPKKPTAGGKAVSAGASAGGAAIGPFLPLIGAVVAGVIGAGLWAAVAHFTGYEVRFVATIVGVMCGIGALIGTDGEGNIGSACIAVAAAFAAIFVGKMITFNIYINSDEYKSIKNEIASSIASVEYTLDEMLPEDVQSRWAYERVEIMINENRVIDWPGDEMDLDWAYYPDDYPRAVVREVEDRWNGLNEDEQLAAREEELEEMRGELKELSDQLERGPSNAQVADGVYESLDHFDVIWALASLTSAFGIGSGLFINQ